MLLLFLNLPFASTGATLEQLFAHQAAKEHFHSESQQRKLIGRASLGGEPYPQKGLQVSSPDSFKQHAACSTACKSPWLGLQVLRRLLRPAHVLAGPLDGNVC